MTQLFFNAILSQMRLRLGLIFALVGYAIVVVGAVPKLFGLDRSPVVGFVQLSVMMLGLLFFCLGGCLSLASYWKGTQLSIAADFGWRVVSSGFLIALSSALADFSGLGTQPQTEYLCFGPWQERGVLLGMMVIGAGFLLMYPWPSKSKVQQAGAKPEAVSSNVVIEKSSSTPTKENFS